VKHTQALDKKKVSRHSEWLHEQRKKPPTANLNNIFGKITLLDHCQNCF